MESQNKLFEEFKAAAAADEQTTFLAQDKLWGRIEQQLDKQETKSIKLFSFKNIKYMAAGLVLVLGTALSWNYFLNGKNEPAPVAKTQSVNVPETQVSEQLPLNNESQTGLKTEEAAIASNPVRVQKMKESVGLVPEESVAQEEPVSDGPYLTFSNFTKTPESFKDRLEIRSAAAQTEELNFAEVLSVPELTKEVKEEFPEERLVKVQGIIVDKAGVALPNAKVSISGTERLVISDAAGKFTLDAPDTSEFIIVQSYGNETKYVKISDRHSYKKIEISPDKNNVALLNDIARYNKSNGMQNLYSSPLSTTSTRQELASKQKQQTMMRQAPSSEPLIIVNGAPYGGKFSDINSRHIKEVKILPDATGRALYGDRAKNGVIVITLKKGKTVSGQ